MCRICQNFICRFMFHMFPDEIWVTNQYTYCRMVHESKNHLYCMQASFQCSMFRHSLRIASLLEEYRKNYCIDPGPKLEGKARSGLKCQNSTDSSVEKQTCEVWSVRALLRWLNTLVGLLLNNDVSWDVSDEFLLEGSISVFCCDVSILGDTVSESLQHSCLLFSFICAH